MSDCCFLCSFGLDQTKACILKIFGFHRSRTHHDDAEEIEFLRSFSHSVHMEDTWDNNEHNLTRTIRIKVSDPSDGARVTTREEKMQAADYLTTPKLLASCQQRNSITRAKNLTRPENDIEFGFICEEYIIVSAAIDAALEEQWNVVYDPGGIEKDRERGGLVLQDGSANPGHFCFGPKPNAPPLSPISQIPGTFGGLVRVGDCSEVYAGWDHTEVHGHDPATFHYADLVYAHFHVHADNVDLGEYRRRRGRCGSGDSKTEGKRGLLLPPSDPCTSSVLSHLRGTTTNFESTPSLGDIAAWIGYHRNLTKAFVLTRNTSWLLCKWVVPGHGKGGIECPLEIYMPWIGECERRCHEPITQGKALLQEISRHGFSIYTRNLADREPGVDGVYQLWNCQTGSGSQPDTRKQVDQLWNRKTDSTLTDSRKQV